MMTLPVQLLATPSSTPWPPCTPLLRSPCALPGASSSPVSKLAPRRRSARRQPHVIICTSSATSSSSISNRQPWAITDLFCNSLSASTSRESSRYYISSAPTSSSATRSQGYFFNSASSARPTSHHERRASIDFPLQHLLLQFVSRVSEEPGPPSAASRPQDSQA